jgi:O-methyltransferase involved in polyketide biosynthesis
VPATLRWVDVDLPAILEYKRETIGDAKPLCNYEAVAADLTDAAARRTLFARLGSGSRRAIVVTEGLLIYLAPEQVAALASDLHEQPAFQSWLIDLASPQLLAYMSKSWGASAAKGNAPFRFAPPDSASFFAPLSHHRRHKGRISRCRQAYILHHHRPRDSPVEHQPH